ncbi:hypothetical protein B5C07_07085 [Staphylococcus delphini]|uniref:Uncharacterized protein n=1 Tax=Staphylococcus delphini TaxID=53344 RepID=A0AAX0QUE6_9STAP|nr:hypothetical protein B5C07_07085 [Staphylococcus delphini]RIZ55544.1 hypothetical protein CDL68_02295 [Staphylococcus delphini]
MLKDDGIIFITFYCFISIAALKVIRIVRLIECEKWRLLFTKNEMTVSQSNMTIHFKKVQNQTGVQKT